MFIIDPYPGRPFPESHVHRISRVGSVGFAVWLRGLTVSSRTKPSSFSESGIGVSSTELLYDKRYPLSNLLRVWNLCTETSETSCKVHLALAQGSDHDIQTGYKGGRIKYSVKDSRRGFRSGPRDNLVQMANVSEAHPVAFFGPNVRRGDLGLM